MDTHEIAKLEALIDRHTLAVVLETIAMICREKADHLRCAWQDAQTARVWDRTARQVERHADASRDNGL